MPVYLKFYLHQFEQFVLCYQLWAMRRIADPMIHKILSKLLMTPPEIWTANFITILEKQAST